MQFFPFLGVLVQGVFKKEDKLKRKERAFCVFISQGKSTEEAALMAGFKKENQGMLLMSRQDICTEIIRLSNERKNLYKSLAFAGYERLAYGGVSDALTLLNEENLNSKSLEGKDLFMVSEIKKPKEGALEIKFFDRFKALEKLAEETNDDKKSLPFYEALENGAKALGNVYE
jgi:hypothetical protein